MSAHGRVAPRNPDSAKAGATLGRAKYDPDELQVGVYDCSPTGSGFTCLATDLRIEA